MHPTPPPLDIVTVAIALVSLAVGPELAAQVGPYSVILLSAVGGAAWSASASPEASRLLTLRHMLAMVGLALIGTVPLAEGLARLAGIEARWAFGPVAAIIAARPDWVLAWARGWFDRKQGGTQ
ncbi:MAG TPA: hypothetical protein VNV16_11615 [Methylibium sp.]|nr:hypothetical protein [Methylibium sp.]